MGTLSVDKINIQLLRKLDGKLYSYFDYFTLTIIDNMIINC